MKIFANHAHIYQNNAYGGSVDNLRRTMDACGIDRAVAFAPLPPDYVREGGLHQNEWLARQIACDPNITGFGVIDFALGDLRGQVDQIRQLGFKGIKLHPAEQRLRINSPEAFEVYARAEELGLVISFHTGVHWHRISDYNMLLYDEVAYNFKKLQITLEHVGGYSFFTEAMAVLVNSPNTYAGLTSVFDPEVNRFWYLNDEKLHDLMWMIGPERCVFGLDFPWNGVDKITAALAKINSLDITGVQREGILGGNLARLLDVAL